MLAKCINFYCTVFEVQMIFLQIKMHFTTVSHVILETRFFAFSNSGYLLAVLMENCLNLDISHELGR